MFKLFSSRRVVVQLTLVFFVVILIMGLGVGLPSMLIMSRQTNNQLNALIDQSNQTTRVLLDNKASHLQDLVQLIADRPTLNQLLEDTQDTQSLSEYLDDFQENIQVDVIAVCDSASEVVSIGESVSSTLCDITDPKGITLLDERGWWLSGADISGSPSPGQRVIVGQSLESIFAEFGLQANLSYALYSGGQLLSSNLPDDLTSLPVIQSGDVQPYQIISLEDNSSGKQDYLAVNIPLSDELGYEMVGLMDISTSLALNQQLRNTILIILVLLSLLGAILAVLISRRFSKPLNQLARSATAMQEGDLSTRIIKVSKIWEVDQLSKALEDARISLKHSLDQLRKERDWIENLLNSIVEGILTIDDQARITYASEAIERLTDSDLSNMLGQSVDHFFSTAPGEDLFSHQIPTGNQSRRFPVLINGKEVLLSLSTSQFVPLEAGNATRALVVRDVTDEERIHRLMGEFMANITHEFRTPLSALSASVELLMDQLPDLTTPEITELVGALNVGIVNLQSFIDNLIEAASIEGGRFKVNVKPTAFQGIIDDAVSMIEPIAQRQGIKINQPKNKQTFLVMADQRRTSQALVNLLTNAIKFSPQDGQINLSTVLMGDQVLIEVSDEGRGVSEERQSQLFNRFISSSSNEDDTDFGLGLGLAVVKAIIEAQNGSVGFKNREDGGAIFWITLPTIMDKEQ
jgi:signal transduction histidine kinase